jgi:hypothetical protein
MHQQQHQPTNTGASAPRRLLHEEEHDVGADFCDGSNDNVDDDCHVDAAASTVAPACKRLRTGAETFENGHDDGDAVMMSTTDNDDDDDDDAPTPPHHQTTAAAAAAASIQGHPNTAATSLSPEDEVLIQMVLCGRGNADNKNDGRSSNGGGGQWHRHRRQYTQDEIVQFCLQSGIPLSRMLRLDLMRLSSKGCGERNGGGNAATPSAPFL